MNIRFAVSIVLLLSFTASPAFAGGPPEDSEELVFTAPIIGTKFFMVSEKGKTIENEVLGVDGLTVRTKSGGREGRSVGLFYNLPKERPVADFEKIIESVWPLRVGKAVEFSYQQKSQRGNSQVTEKMSVVRTEESEALGAKTTMYVVEMVTKNDAYPGVERLNTYWFSPMHHLVVKFNQKWSGGSDTPAPFNWAVTKVILPNSGA